MDGILLESLIIVGFGLVIWVYVHFTTSKREDKKHSQNHNLENAKNS